MKKTVERKHKRECEEYDGHIFLVRKRLCQRESKITKQLIESNIISHVAAGAIKALQQQNKSMICMGEEIAMLCENVANTREELKKEKASKIVVQRRAKDRLAKVNEMRALVDGLKESLT